MKKNRKDCRVLLSKTLLILLALLVAQAGAQEPRELAYSLTLRYNAGEISVDELFVTPAFVNETLLPWDDAYWLELFSFDNKTLYLTNFVFPLEVTHSAPPEWFDEEGNQIFFPNASELPPEAQDTVVQVLVPYYKNGSKIVLYDPDFEPLLEVDVSHFADVCGDLKCQPHEDRRSCSVDCPSGVADYWCDGERDLKCDPDCKPHEDPDCLAPTPTPVVTPLATPTIALPPIAPAMLAVIILIGLIAVVAVVLLLILRLRGKGALGQK